MKNQYEVNLEGRECCAIEKMVSFIVTGLNVTMKHNIDRDIYHDIEPSAAFNFFLENPNNELSDYRVTFTTKKMA